MARGHVLTREDMLTGEEGEENCIPVVMATGQGRVSIISDVLMPSSSSCGREGEERGGRGEGEERGGRGKGDKVNREERGSPTHQFQLAPGLV